MLTDDEIIALHQRWDETTGSSYADLMRAVERAVYEQAANVLKNADHAGPVNADWLDGWNEAAKTIRALKEQAK